ncbi:hypothetical protein M3A82_004595 [Micrococcus luteus]|uniref:Uncharacterized protein n=1 Tax=Micrococcus luteus TaxID=1270 RepID=A0AAP3AGF8_MICLU|nr:hypothetical protein [Micrococcus luteus]
MGSPWIEDDEDEAWDETPAVTDGPTGTPLPYVDPGVAAELAQDGPPVWMGTRWRDIAAEHQWEAWNALRRWVDWFVAEYRLTTSVVPPCWYKHSDVTAELYGAMCMEYKVWEEQAPGLGPMMMWHPQVEMLTGRLRRMVDEAGCTKVGQHKEPEWFDGGPAFTLSYDEDDFLVWADTAREIHSLARPGEGVEYWRARVVDAEGTQMAGSNIVGLAAAQHGQGVQAEVLVLSSTPSQPQVTVVVRGARDGANIRWRSSKDGRRWHE